MKKLFGIKAITFDGDDTLWDFEKVMKQALQRVLEGLRQTDPEIAALLTIEKMIEARKRVAKELKGKVTNLEEIRLRAFERTLEEIGEPDKILAYTLNESYLRHRFENVELFDDVMPTLKALQSKFVIGLLSNGNTYPDRSGLEKIFQFVIFSQDHKVEKPNRRIFMIALRQADCFSNELLHVGNSPFEDVQGAYDVGIKNVWLNREKQPNPLDIEVEYEVESLTELLHILEV